MDAIEFTCKVAELTIPEDDLPAFSSEEHLDDALAELSDETLFAYLKAFRDLVLEARQVRDDALEEYDSDEDMVPVSAVLPAEDAAWIVSTKERDV